MMPVGKQYIQFYGKMQGKMQYELYGFCGRF